MEQPRVFTLSDIEVRSGDGSAPPRIDGHAAVYNTWSQDLGGFKERVLPGAFTKSLVGSDVRALFNHDPNYVLGRKSSGTLTLSDETKGLRINVTPPDTQTIRDLVLEPMRRGDINQMSFAFRVREEEWREPKKVGGLQERDLIDLELYDISVVAFPAYPQASAVLRSLPDNDGLNYIALASLIARAKRGLPLTSSDADLIQGSVALLRSFVPEPSTPEEGAGETPEEGAPEAGRSPAHYRAMFAMELASVLPAMG